MTTGAEPGLPSATIRPYRSADHAAWLLMRLALWPDADQANSADADAMAWLARPDAAVLVAHPPDCPGPVGFAEVGHRPFADGCRTAPVAFLEAWYVDPGHRGKGLGAALIQAVQSWARARGFRELASDALLENLPAQRAHQAVGFEEVERSVKFRKPL